MPWSTAGERIPDQKRQSSHVLVEDDVGEALREAIEARYERLRGLLDERLGLDPTQETRAVYRQLLGQS